jgi:membrane protease YdiL (CAAX protease family)
MTNNIPLEPGVPRDEKSWFIIVVTVGIILFAQPLLASILTYVIPAIWAELFGKLVSFGFVWLIIASRLKQHKISVHDWIFPFKKKWILLGVIYSLPLALLGIVTSLATVHIISIWNYQLAIVMASHLFNSQIFSQSIFVILIAAAIYSLWIPIVEELLFRGYIISSIGAKFSVRSGIVSSVAIFAMLHSEIIGHAIYALVFSILVLRSRSLVAAIFSHISLNIWAFILPALFPKLRSAQGATQILDKLGSSILLIAFGLVFCTVSTAIFLMRLEKTSEVATARVLVD